MIVFFITAAIAGVVLAIATLIVLWIAITKILDAIIQTLGRQ